MRKPREGSEKRLGAEELQLSSWKTMGKPITVSHSLLLFLGYNGD